MSELSLNTTGSVWTKVAALILVAAVTFLLFFVERSDGILLMTAAVVAALTWWIAHRGLNWKEALSMGLLMRFGALFAFPLLSDDIYRFLWDGELWLAGYHPLDFLPSEAPSAFAKTHPTLLSKMNSAGYYTVYPPISQLVYAFGAWLGGTVESATMWLKLPLFLGELGVLRLLYLLEGEGKRQGLAAYALLPLPIVEIMGNAHFEGLAVLGVLGAVYSFRPRCAKVYGQNKPILSGAWISFGVLAKLVPLLGAPAVALAFLWKRGEKTTWSWMKAIGFGVSSLVFVGLGMTLFLASADLSGFSESLDLYFRKFEFNGSLYTLASALGQWYKGWNWIGVVGPTLSIISMLSILTLAFVRGWKNLDLATTLLFSFGIYILFATTVHPWYAIYLVALAPLTRYKWPYALGFTVFLSYLAYGTTDTVVPVWATVVEYELVLGILIFEIFETGSRRIETDA